MVFEVEHSETLQRLLVKGAVSCPWIELDKDSIQFYPIQPNMTTTESLQLINHSPYPTIAILEGSRTLHSPSVDTLEAQQEGNDISEDRHMIVVFFGDEDLAKQQAGLMADRYNLPQTTLLQLIQVSVAFTDLHWLNVSPGS